MLVRKIGLFDIEHREEYTGTTTEGLAEDDPKVQKDVQYGG
jgi:hypothetical protein